jgi:hydroxymethylpyrimidine pyrophosphatase-like HAD family hydrolase
MNDYEIYAVDFDGTLCENKWPEIGKPIQPMIDYCIKLREEGHKLILWTCRTGEQTEAAVKWCAEHELEFDAVNANLPDEIIKYNNDPRKIGADYFLDDKNLSIDKIIRKNTPLTATKVNILGTEYEILFRKISEDKLLKTADGYIGKTVKKIVIGEKEDDCELEDFEEHQKKVIRHEIIHAFFMESGLRENFENSKYGISETLVDWFAIQSPKIFKVYEELGIL